MCLVTNNNSNNVIVNNINVNIQYYLDTRFDEDDESTMFRCYSTESLLNMIYELSLLIVINTLNKTVWLILQLKIWFKYVFASIKSCTEWSTLFIRVNYYDDTLS